MSAASPTERLVALLEQSRSETPFECDTRGRYHVLASLILSQRIRFRHGQRIRAALYDLLGEYSLRSVMALSAGQRAKCGVLPRQEATLQAFHAAYTRHGQAHDFSTVPGIGSWTERCSRIMVGDFSAGFVENDLAVRRELSRRLGAPRRLTESGIRKLMVGVPLREQGRLFSVLWNATRK